MDQARRRPAAWLVLALGVAAAAAAVLGGRAAADAIVAMLSPGTPPLAISAIFYLAVFVPLWLVPLTGGLVEGRRVWLAEPAAVRAAILGLGLGLTAFSAAVAVAAGGGAVVRGASSAGAVGGLLAGVCIFALQAGGEEVFFRGWIQPVLCARWGPWLGLMVASLLFAGLHLVGGVHGPLAMVNLLLAGLWFGLLALRTGGLWAAFLAHFGWNWAESCLYGLDPNPGVAATGSLVDLDLTGGGIWSGGADAMNGSLATTLVLTVLVAALVALERRKG